MTASRRPWYRRIIPMLGLGGFVVAAGGTGWLTDQGVKRLVVPRQYAAEPWMNEITNRPEACGFSLRKFTVSAADGLTLQAMMATPSTAAGTTTRGQVVLAALKQAGLPVDPDKTSVRGTLLLLHGFNARKEHMHASCGTVLCRGIPLRGL